MTSTGTGQTLNEHNKEEGCPCKVYEAKAERVHPRGKSRVGTGRSFPLLSLVNAQVVHHLPVVEHGRTRNTMTLYAGQARTLRAYGAKKVLTVLRSIFLLAITSTPPNNKAKSSTENHESLLVYAPLVVPAQQ